jgi:dolichol-phosphate mannosyltransferase
MLDMPERHRFLRGLVSWMGFRRTFVPFEAPERIAGESKYNARKMFKLALDAMLSFSATPMRVASRFGLALVLMGLGYLGYILLRGAIFGDLVTGWSSVISVALILGGAQLAFIGLIGEYMARVFEEVKGRPLYFFKQVPPQQRRAAQRTTTQAAPFVRDSSEMPRVPEPIEQLPPAAASRVRVPLG